MKIIFESDNDFSIGKGKLTALGDKSFVVEKQGNSIIISDDGMGSCNSNSQTIIGNGNIVSRGRGNNISINNNTVCVNGFKIKVVGSSVIIDGDADEVIYNGQNILNGNFVAIDEPKEPKENEYTSYDLDAESIDSIEIKSSGSLYIRDNQCLCENNLAISIIGSGSITLNEVSHFVKNIATTIMGSGDINISKIQSDSLTASVMGSGDLEFKQSDFNNVSLSIMGSGDIDFKKCSANNVSKNIMGSGDISGIN